VFSASSVTPPPAVAASPSQVSSAGVAAGSSGQRSQTGSFELLGRHSAFGDSLRKDAAVPATALLGTRVAVVWALAHRLVPIAACGLLLLFACAIVRSWGGLCSRRLAGGGRRGSYRDLPAEEAGLRS